MYPKNVLLQLNSTKTTICQTISLQQAHCVAACRGSEMAGLVARMAAWRILQHMYDAMEAEEIEQHLLPAVGKNAVRSHVADTCIACHFTPARGFVSRGHVALLHIDIVLQPFQNFRKVLESMSASPSYQARP